jgi:hypothetical protein
MSILLAPLMAVTPIFGLTFAPVTFGMAIQSQAYYIVSNAGNVTITVDNVALSQTQTEKFTVQVVDCDTAQYANGSTGLVDNTTGNLSVAPFNVSGWPAGFSLQFDTIVSSTPFKCRYKAKTASTPKGSFVAVWTFTDHYEMFPPNDGETAKSQTITVN